MSNGILWDKSISGRTGESNEGDGLGREEKRDTLGRCLEGVPGSGRVEDQHAIEITLGVTPVGQAHRQSSEASRCMAYRLRASPVDPGPEDSRPHLQNNS